MALRSLVSMLIFRSRIKSSIFKFLPSLCKYSRNGQYCIISSSLNLRTYHSRPNASPKSGFDQNKATIVLKLNLKSPEDALPFYNLPVKTLIHIYKTTKNDEENGFCNNRLYYIATRINVPPAVLSEKLAKRHFVYSLSFDWIKKALDALLEMGVSGDRILRDLWVLKYHHETIQNRLQIVKDNGIENLYPWMVRCSEDILKRFITISQETKDILGETKSTQIYLANRLNTSIEAVEDMCFRMPALKTIRVTKVKNFLDFLINEGFEVEDIANKLRVLSASQKTVKERIVKLRELGISPINLNVLYRSKKSFKKYCDSFESALNESDKNTCSS